MNSLLDTLKGYTAHVFITPSSTDGGFRLAVGLLGKPCLTSPALTEKIQEPQDFDLLDNGSWPTRILEMVLAHAQG